MIKNYLQVALRNLTKQKAFACINIFGLAIGIACCMAIMLFVGDELSYDRFNVLSARTYRVRFHALLNNRDMNFAASCAPLASILRQDFPEVSTVTRLVRLSNVLLRYQDRAITEEKFDCADSTFFDVFSVRCIAGNPKTALTQPNTLVITETVAKKYFGNDDPMGKILISGDGNHFMVTGVVGGFPHNAHFQFDFLASLATYRASREGNLWLNKNFYTYVVLREGTDADLFEAKMNAGLRKYIGPQLKSDVGVTYEQFESSGNRISYVLQPLTSIHLHSHLDSELMANGDIAYVWIFASIAVAILLIACMNFMSLSTARSERRAKEVGVRKTLGSTRGELIVQFLVESIVMSIIAGFLAVALVEILLPFFNTIAEKQLSFGLFDNVYSIPFLILFILVVGLVAGTYPAFYLSSFLPVQVLKSEGRKRSRKSSLRRTLVIFQFAVSIILFISTIVIYQQLGFIQDTNLGFNKNQVVIINRADHIGAALSSFKQELLGHPAVTGVSNSTGIPGDQDGERVFVPEGGTTGDAQDVRTVRSDVDFADTYQIPMFSGRFLSKDHPADSMAVVMNQAAVSVFRMKDPVGKVLEDPFTPPLVYRYDIVGVMNDFHFESLHQLIRPLVVGLFRRGEVGRFLAVRIVSSDVRGTMAFLGNTWKKYAG
ncbi:MAG TPA: ABC transporter permease, partial [Bacteroidota bacterium]|nr:ABC transporter permease [Bacteroidota bacterium]